VKIRTIAYKNFRTYAEEGRLDFDTDGKVNIVYGDNGVGKTTLHQLFRWVLYNTVDFNESSSDKLYNFASETNAQVGDKIEVWGEIAFEHNGKEFVLKRTQFYKRTPTRVQEERPDVLLQYKNNNGDWVKLKDSTSDYIEKMLPVGLSPYFFFDGERMITDLMKKGHDSSKKLQKALHTIFGLNLYQNAVEHIGSVSTKQSVIGTLNLKRGKSDNPDTQDLTRWIDDTMSELESKVDYKKELEEKSNDNALRLKSLSEKIGGAKTRQAYEEDRQKWSSQSKTLQKQIDDAQKRFGKELTMSYSPLIVASRFGQAKQTIVGKLDKIFLPSGLNKELVNAILQDATQACICGQTIDEVARKKLEDYLPMLPPLSLKVVYDTFVQEINELQNGTPWDVNGHLKSITELKNQQDQADKSVQEIDESLKSMPDIQQLVDDRQSLETDQKYTQQRLVQTTAEIQALQQKSNKLQKDFDNAVKGNQANALIEKQIALITKVKEFFEQDLQKLAKEYSAQMEKSIAKRLETMLRTKRNVEMSEDFLLKVFDNYGDEYKSEGQFAVVSFAYIGGIFDVLCGQEDAIKEYPLVLDGPFSKLDAENRQKVLDTIPDYAPQIIVFSKDKIDDLLPASKVGQMYQITSNEHANVAVISKI